MLLSTRKRFLRRMSCTTPNAAKANIVKKAFTGPVTPNVPASILQMHPDVTIICDAEAYAQLEQ